MSPIMSINLCWFVIYVLILIQFQQAVEEENRGKKEQIEPSQEESNRAGMTEDGYNEILLAMIAEVSIPALVGDHHCKGGW